MYSNSLLNSLKYCECDNNNLCSVTIMNKVNRDKGTVIDGIKPKKDKNCNEYNENEANAEKKQPKTLGKWLCFSWKIFKRFTIVH